MNNRIRISEQPQPVEWLAEQYAAGDIYVPEFQRLWSWTGARGLKKMQCLIDSVMNGFPIPSVILNRRADRRHGVYDGRHRIETFCKFRRDEFKWNGMLYSELPPAEKERFDLRTIPVTVTVEASEEQLADVFMRLNNGVPLTDSDKLWARRSSPVVDATRRLVIESNRLREALGGVDLHNRRDLANWVSLVVGIVTNNAGNMTTSYVRLCNLLDSQVDDRLITTRIEALCDVLERANAAFPATNTEKKRFKTRTKLSAYFLAEFMETPTEAIKDKWVGVIGRLRGNESERATMSAALTTSGAQNLTARKVEQVLAQVNHLLGGGVVTPLVDYEDDDDSEQ